MQEDRGLMSGRSQNMTHRVLGVGSALGFVLALASEVVTQVQKSSRSEFFPMFYMLGTVLGAYTSAVSALYSDGVVKVRRCDGDELHVDSYHGVNARRLLASLGLTSYLIMFTAKMAENPQLVPAGVTMAAVATVNNSVLGLPKRDETGYILFGICGGITSAGLLINDMTKAPTPQDILLAIANAILLTMCVASTAINIKRHRVEISEAQGFVAKVKAMILGGEDRLVIRS